MGSPLVAGVSGPIRGLRPPIGGPTFDPAALGYVCEDYLLSGSAVAYGLVNGGRPPVDGKWAAEEVGRGEYRTRILVLRPQDPARFNGTVLLNWQNVSAGCERSRPEADELYRGYAWVGVSAQEIGLYGAPYGTAPRGSHRPRLGLIDEDPERYGELSHPGDLGSFEIFSQAASAVGPLRDGATDPLGGLEVQRVVAIGGSQSAMRLVAYANAVHPLHHVVDGFVLSVWEGRAPRLDEGAISEGGVRTTIRDDLDVPVLVINSEFEAQTTAGVDLDDTVLQRIWEVTGTGHGAWRRPIVRAGPHRETPNPLSWAPVHEAALRRMYEWLAHGIPAPAQPRIQMDPKARGSVARDELGNGLGGIRLPEIEAPIAAYRGTAYGTGAPPLFGGRRLFGPDVLEALYSDRDAYLGRWDRAVNAMVASGTLLPEDAERLKERGHDTATTLPLDAA